MRGQGAGEGVQGAGEGVQGVQRVHGGSGDAGTRLRGAGVRWGEQSRGRWKSSRVRELEGGGWQPKGCRGCRGQVEGGRREPGGEG